MIDKIPGPPNPPMCKHGKVFSLHRRNCPECLVEEKEIKEKVYPLIEDYWKSKGEDSLYHIVYRAYRMGMRHDTD